MRHIFGPEQLLLHADKSDTVAQKSTSTFDLIGGVFFSTFSS